MHIEHQRLVRAGLFGGDAGEDAVELGVRVQLGILGHRQPAQMRDGRKPNRAGERGARVLHDDHEGGAGAGQARVLERPDFYAAGDHQPGMGVSRHIIGDAGFLQRGDHTSRVQPDIEIDRLGRLEEPRDMFVEKRPAPVVEPQTLPYAVAEHETAVIDTYCGLGARQELAVDVNQDRVVAGVVLGLVGGDGVWHGVLPLRGR